MTNVCGGGSLSIGSQLQKDDEKINYRSDEQIQKLLDEEYDILFNASAFEEDTGIIRSSVDALDEYVEWANAYHSAADEGLSKDVSR